MIEVTTILAIVGTGGALAGLKCIMCKGEIKPGDHVYKTTTDDGEYAVTVATHDKCTPEATKVRAMGDRRN